MARNFCKTWWGNAWLQALSHIDYSNRIPRGARYARNGSVKSVEFDDNKIKAKVQGSRRTSALDNITSQDLRDFPDTIYALKMSYQLALHLMMKGMVHRFITKNTFEERINDMINNKRALAELTVSSGENWIGKLSNRELKEIFG